MYLSDNQLQRQFILNQGSIKLFNLLLYQRGFPSYCRVTSAE
jgi:hypothetical protein